MVPNLTIAKAEPFAESGRGQPPAGSGSCPAVVGPRAGSRRPPEPDGERRTAGGKEGQLLSTRVAAPDRGGTSRPHPLFHSSW